MSALPVIAIFDIGKTNKKLFLIDESYRFVFERSTCFPEISDEDGDPCEDLQTLEAFVRDHLKDALSDGSFEVRAVNFSTYGASFVHIGETGKPVTPLYNYLKPFPEDLKVKFYAHYGGEQAFSYTTASPVLGNLNSGMQLYRLKYERPQTFEKIRYSLHLPQYMSYLLTGNVCADLTSVGCHTNLWDFHRNSYHEWVYKEGIVGKLPDLVSAESVRSVSDGRHTYQVGTGLHDSSAALIPYLVSMREPFVLLSTGTWCISLNPFNTTPLTAAELDCDCLCYLTYTGQPVKASRLFAGNEHAQQVERIAGHFGTQAAKYRSIRFDPQVLFRLKEKQLPRPVFPDMKTFIQQSVFGRRDLASFATDEEAYYQLIIDIVSQQHASTSLVLKGSGAANIFVDGGFSANEIFMNVLATAFPGQKVFAASVAQSTAVGTAMAIHRSWNNSTVPSNLIERVQYSGEDKEVF